MLNFSEEFNGWLTQHGNGKSIPKNFRVNQTDFSFIPPDFAIQQNELEIMKLIEILEKHNCKNILEIGLGYFGSTHVLFREHFESVCTVEISIDRVKNFYFNAERHFGENYFKEKQSAFIVSNSNSVEAPQKLMKHLEQKNFKLFDALFIDGFHGYGTVLLDFLIYSNFVKKGGVIAFHDVSSSIEDSGVPKFIQDLKKINLNNVVDTYEEIIYSDDLGIGYFLKK